MRRAHHAGRQEHRATQVHRHRAPEAEIDAGAGHQGRDGLAEVCGDLARAQQLGAGEDAVVPKPAPVHAAVAHVVTGMQHQAEPDAPDFRAEHRKAHRGEAGGRGCGPGDRPPVARTQQRERDHQADLRLEAGEPEGGAAEDRLGLQQREAGDEQAADQKPVLAGQDIVGRRRRKQQRRGHHPELRPVPVSLAQRQQQPGKRQHLRDRIGDGHRQQAEGRQDQKPGRRIVKAGIRHGIADPRRESLVHRVGEPDLVVGEVRVAVAPGLRSGIENQPVLAEGVVGRPDLAIAAGARRHDDSPAVEAERDRHQGDADQALARRHGHVACWVERRQGAVNTRNPA